MYSFSSDEDEETYDDDEEYRKPKSKKSKKGKNAAYAGPPRKTLDEIEAEQEAEKRRNEHAHLMDVFTKLEEQRRQYDAEQRRIEYEARRQYEARQEATMNAQLQLTQALVNALRPAQPAQSAVWFSPRRRKPPDYEQSVSPLAGAASDSHVTGQSLSWGSEDASAGSR
jgi:hypothetical protein